MIESDAWKTASNASRLFVERVMLEHMAHGGNENGKLPVTFDDCVAHGISRGSIKSAQASAIARGLVYMTEKGIPGREGKPSRFGLGWLPGHDGSPPPNRWKAWVRPPVTRRVIRKGGTLPKNVESSTELGTVLSDGKPPFPESKKAETVPDSVLETVPKSVLNKKTDSPRNTPTRSLQPNVC
jgi:hypothetical protein